VPATASPCGSWRAGTLPRATVVRVRRPDGSLVGYQRQPGEPPEAFAARLTGLDPSTRITDPGREAPADFAALLRGDVELAGGASVYALYPAQLDATRVRLLDAAELVGALAG
jgi:hypothetical protein